MQKDSETTTSSTTTTSNWLGTGMFELYKENGPWNFYVSPVIPSKNHHVVLYELPITTDSNSQVIPHCNKETKWDLDHVRLPCHPNNLYPVIEENGQETVKSRWSIIRQALSAPIKSSYDLEKAINSYNNRLPKFEALHHYFTEVIDESECEHFFTNTLPRLIDLALSLPNLIPGNIPFLKRSQNKSISMSQLQVSCLLANAFLCTFPWCKDVAASNPGVNFTRLFASSSRPKRVNCVTEKIKCICHYFSRVLKKAPTGTITFKRKSVSKHNMPRWDKLKNNLGNTRIHVTHTGTIEDGLGFLQIDFANKFIGGGVLGYGCVQEEIRFVICPELIVSRLFVEVLDDNEAVIITGAERFSNYEGYGDTFKWAGPAVDLTPSDEYRRKKTTIAVIDATRFHKTAQQFYPSAILRELNKAFVGFSGNSSKNLAPIATGNWGCGAFNGSVYLKTLIQLIACSAAERDLVYYSFGNADLMREFYNMYLFLANNRVTIAQLWRFLHKFGSRNLAHDKLYSYIQQSYFDMNNQPKISDIFKPSTSFSFKKSDTKKVKIKEFESATTTTTSIETFRNNDDNEDNSPDIIECTPPLEQPAVKKKIVDKIPKNHKELVDIMDLLDGKNNTDDIIKETRIDLFDEEEKEGSVCDKMEVEEIIKVDCIDDANTNLMDIEVSSQNNGQTDEKKNKKITDYFMKVGKPS